MASPHEREADAFMSFCVAGLLAPIGGSFYVGQATLSHGVVSTIFQIGHLLFVPAIFKKQPCSSQAQLFHPRGWPVRGHVTLSRKPPRLAVDVRFIAQLG